jgi:hypothetical protein
MNAWAWLGFGTLSCAVWIAGGSFFDSSSPVGLVGVPVFAMLYIAAVLVVDQWVMLGRKSSSSL